MVDVRLVMGCRMERAHLQIDDVEQVVPDELDFITPCFVISDGIRISRAARVEDNDARAVDVSRLVEALAAEGPPEDVADGDIVGDVPGYMVGQEVRPAPGEGTGIARTRAAKFIGTRG